MSRKMDWADKEARTLALALGLDSDNATGRALLAATLRLACQRGIGEGMDKMQAALDLALGKGGTTSGSTS